MGKTKFSEIESKEVDKDEKIPVTAIVPKKTLPKTC